MTTTRTPVPPVNLKDRIAALQQRTNNPTHGPEGASSPLGSGSLRDKIANFERQGAVPVPRGRFGTGAPPVGDTSSKKKGELYGNRVPELAKPSPVAALAARRRTISHSRSRPTSPESDLPSPADSSVPPLPSMTSVGRRVASDVLPRSQAVREAIREADQKELSNGSEEPSSTNDTEAPKIPSPAIVVDLDKKSSPSESSAVVATPLQPATTSPSKDDTKTLSDRLKLVEELVQSKEPRPHPAVEVPDLAMDRLPRGSSQGEAETITIPVQTVAVKPTASQLDRPLSSTYSDGSSVADDTTASSDSVPTPSDNTSFLASESPKSEQPVETVSVLSQDIKSNSPINEEPAIKVSAPCSSTISPTTNLAPAPPSASPPLPNSLMGVKVERKVSPSFHAVVHRKVRETAPTEPASTISPPPRAPLAQHKTPTMQRVRAQSDVEPQSPGLGDLAALVFDAALLEEALSGTSSPAKKPSPPPPTFNLEPAIPEDREVDIVKPEPKEKEVAPCPTPALARTPEPVSVPAVAPVEMPDLSTVVEEQLLRPTPQIMPPPRRGSMPPPRVVTSHAQSLSQEPASRHTSFLRPRKQSVSDSYARGSVYSEFSSSEDSSVLVSRPSSPPAGSDTSSVRSSSKSWKSPKKGIGRASSWLFRGKNKGNVVVTEEDLGIPDVPPSPSLLSPYPSAPARPVDSAHSSQPAPRRPPSWVSVSSGGSGDVFDAELVSSFPSVPGVPSMGAMPPSYLHSHTLPPVPALPSGYAQSMNRAHTVAARSTGRQQQHRMI